LGHFEKIDLRTDFEKTALNTSVFRALNWGFSIALRFREGTGSLQNRYASREEVAGEKEF